MRVLGHDLAAAGQAKLATEFLGQGQRSPRIDIDDLRHDCKTPAQEREA
jgi:hypothetical protein